MAVSSIIDTINQTDTSAAKKTSSSSSYDPSDFMDLLLKQLTNQDPMEPMDNSQMMNQLTQLNSLQTMKQIQTSLEQSSTDNRKAYAASLIGKNAMVSDSDGKSVEGKISGFAQEAGKTYVLMGETYYSLDNVMSVWEE